MNHMKKLLLLFLMTVNFKNLPAQFKGVFHYENDYVGEQSYQPLKTWQP